MNVQVPATGTIERTGPSGIATEGIAVGAFTAFLWLAWTAAGDHIRPRLETSLKRLLSWILESHFRGRANLTTTAIKRE